MRIKYYVGVCEREREREFVCVCVSEWMSVWCGGGVCVFFFNTFIYQHAPLLMSNTTCIVLCECVWVGV